MQLRKLSHYRPSWNLFKMKGQPACIFWSMKDVINIDAALGFTKGRSVAVQAGGNVGIFPKRLAEEFKKVYTFEPDPYLVQCVRHNAPEKNIVVTQAALGCSKEPIQMACDRRGVNAHRPVHHGLTYIAGPGNIPQIMLDDLKLTECDLIYLDIEGYELNALRGAEETIKRCRPVIGVEANAHIKFYGSSKEERHQWIVDHGYQKVFSQRGDDIYVPI